MPTASSSVRLRLLLLAACVACAALPAWCAKYPPVTDLPQHLGQLRLLVATLRGAGGATLLQPLTPYWGANVLLLPLGLLLPDRLLPQAAVLLFAVLWAGAVHGLAWVRGRTPEAAALATLFLFSQSLYWGFLPFLAGWPVFLAWLVLLEEDEGPAWRILVLHAAGAALLYSFHALWFAMGLLTLALRALMRRPAGKTLLLQAAAVAPWIALSAWWFPRMAQRAFHSPPQWFRGPWERLSPEGLAAAAFGGLKGSLEGWLLLGVAVWIGLALWQGRRELRTRVDGALLAPALLLLACALVLPDKYSNTIFLAERWLPCALALVLLALPAPRLPAAGLRTWALGALVILSGSTAAAWRAFDRTEMTGLGAAVAAVPEGSRVLGLVFVRESALVAGRPFLQAFAYAEARPGVTVNFSFADFAPSPVVRRVLAPPPWTRGLEWNPEKVRVQDLAHFSHVLAALPEVDHGRLLASGNLAPVTETGIWRLYRVLPPTAAR